MIDLKKVTLFITALILSFSGFCYAQSSRESDRAVMCSSLITVVSASFKMPENERKILSDISIKFLKRSLDNGMPVEEYRKTSRDWDETFKKGIADESTRQIFMNNFLLCMNSSIDLGWFDRSVNNLSILK
jgi:hypothetical protein